MPTSPTTPRSTIYITPAEAESLRHLAADLALYQPGGGGAVYQAGSLSALMRLLAGACHTRHRATLLTFLARLHEVTAARDG